MKTAAHARVVHLNEARLAKRVEVYRAKLEQVLEGNKQGVTRLFQSGLLFSKNGSRAGRDLLTAHEHLLRVMGLVDRLSHRGDVPPPRREEEIETIFLELDTLLETTRELTLHTAKLVDELEPD